MNILVVFLACTLLEVLHVTGFAKNIPMTRLTLFPVGFIGGSESFIQLTIARIATETFGGATLCDPVVSIIGFIAFCAKVTTINKCRHGGDDIIVPVMEIKIDLFFFWWTAINNGVALLKGHDYNLIFLQMIFKRLDLF